MRTVGPKGRIVIPREIRDETGVVEGSEVSVEAKDGEIVIRRIGSPAGSYVDYTATYGEKVGKPETSRESSRKRILVESIFVDSNAFILPVTEEDSNRAKSGHNRFL